MSYEQVMVRTQHAVVYEGAGEVPCDAGDAPHAWDLVLRCSQEEREAFRTLRSQQSVQVQVGGAAVGHALFAAIEAGRVRFTGLGFCPYPTHDRGEGPAGLRSRSSHGVSASGRG